MYARSGRSRAPGDAKRGATRFTNRKTEAREGAERFRCTPSASTFRDQRSEIACGVPISHLSSLAIMSLFLNEPLLNQYCALRDPAIDGAGLDMQAAPL